MKLFYYLDGDSGFCAFVWLFENKVAIDAAFRFIWNSCKGLFYWLLTFCIFIPEKYSWNLLASELYHWSRQKSNLHAELNGFLIAWITQEHKQDWIKPKNEQIRSKLKVGKHQVTPFSTIFMVKSMKEHL